jgi:hypothetical protein
LPNDLLRVAVAAYLARYKGMSRHLVESDLQVFLRWRADRSIDPLAAQRVDVKLFVRWSYELFHHLAVRRPGTFRDRVCDRVSGQGRPPAHPAR